MHIRKSGIALIVALPLTLGLVACDDDAEGVRGSGNVVTEEMAFADFTYVELGTAFKAEITQSDTFGVTIRADDNILELLHVSTADDTLRIRVEPGQSVTDATLEATITMPELDGLTLSGAAQASLSGFRSSGQFDISLSGASHVNGALDAGSVDIQALGASRATLKGSATGLTIRVSGASNLNLADFLVETADVFLSGASEATLNVDGRIDPVNVSGASRLRYLGDPDLGNVTSSGASSVDKIGD